MITKTIKDIHKMIGGNLILNNADESNVVCGVCLDSRKVKKNNLYVAIKGENVDGHSFINKAYENGASLVLADNPEMISDNVPTILVDNSEDALRCLAVEYRKCIKGRFIGITGSNGKTSLKDILNAMLSSKFKCQKTAGNHNNELGVPLTVLSFDEDSECLIVEMGMEQIGDLHFLEEIVKPDIGIVTNVGTAHLLTFKTMDNIGRGKLEMMDILDDNSLFVYNGDDKVLNKVIKEKDADRLCVKKFGDNIDNDVYLTSFKQDEKSIYFKSNLSDFEFKLDILGKHQAYNALAALIVAKSLNLSDEDIQRGLISLENTGMRNELLKINKCTILNDAYKSNPQSALAALQTFDGFKSPKKIVVLADMLDLGDDTNKIHFDLGVDSLKYHYDELVLYGELSKYIKDGVLSVNEDMKISMFNTHEEIASYLKQYLDEESMILFKGSRGMALDKVIDLLKGVENE